MWDRFLNSFELARTSLAVLRKDKELVAFPIISGLLCLLVSASFIVPAWRSGMIGGAVDSMGEETSGIAGYGEVAEPGQEVLSKSTGHGIHIHFSR